ncbi:MAG: hypothetical protein JWM64_2950 [Frankiales bacterium]|nr:hypothetical protein [Frankiales bacterium]
MRSHDHDHDHETGGSDAARADRTERADAPLLAAAAAGRPDVLGPRGMLALQRAVGNAGSRGLAEQAESPVLGVVGSGGQALEAPVRQDMEQRFGEDFGSVRVHTDDTAHASAQSVGAHAYTVGSDVVFQRDAYDPSSTAGLTTLAHELTHVVQQRSGPVDGTPTGDGVQVSDPSDRFEQEAAANAERLVSSPAPTTSAAPVQREAADGGQGAVVQREEAVEEEAEGESEHVDPVQREAAEEEEVQA